MTGAGQLSTFVVAFAAISGVAFAPAADASAGIPTSMTTATTEIALTLAQSRFDFIPDSSRVVSYGASFGAADARYKAGWAGWDAVGCRPGPGQAKRWEGGGQAGTRPAPCPADR
jgi:hypothetical protein